MRKIIVVAPIKNESWILDTFLKSCSLFADHILLADQQSTDGSLDIAKRFPKVTVIRNTNEDFNENERQLILINNARTLFPGDNVIFALDADEIIAADSIHSSSWDKMKQTEGQHTFYFEKPDLYIKPGNCIRHEDDYFPLAFSDNSQIEHTPDIIHSTRIPVCEEKTYIKDIVFLHLAYLRPAVQRAKFRFYSVQEQVFKTQPWYRRRKRYKSPNHLLPGHRAEKTPAEWLLYPAGISLEEIKDNESTWHNEVVVEMVRKHGPRAFWLDDIWDLKELNSSPPFLIRIFLKAFDYAFIERNIYKKVFRK